MKAWALFVLLGCSSKAATVEVEPRFYCDIIDKTCTTSPCPEGVRCQEQHLASCTPEGYCFVGVYECEAVTHDRGRCRRTEARDRLAR